MGVLSSMIGRRLLIPLTVFQRSFTSALITLRMLEVSTLDVAFIERVTEVNLFKTNLLTASVPFQQESPSPEASSLTHS